MSKVVNKKSKRKVVSNKPKTSHRDLQVINAANKVLNEMYIVFSSSHEEPVRFGVEQLKHLVNSKPRMIRGAEVVTDYELAKRALNIDLNTTKRTWSFWVGIYTEVEGKIECYITAGDIEEATAVDLSEQMAYVTKSCAKEVLNETDIQPTAWSWVVAPNQRYDFTTAEDALMEMFIKEYRVCGPALEGDAPLVNPPDQTFPHKAHALISHVYLNGGAVFRDHVELTEKAFEKYSDNNNYVFKEEELFVPRNNEDLYASPHYQNRIGARTMCIYRS